MIKKTILFAIVLISQIVSGYAKELHKDSLDFSASESNIYKRVFYNIDSIILGESGKVMKKRETRFNFLIVKRPLEFKEKNYNWIYANLITDTVFKNLHYRSNVTDTFPELDFTPFMYRFVKYKEFLFLSDSDEVYKREKDKKITFLPIRIELTNVVYSNDPNFAMVNTKFTYGYNGHYFLYSYIFEKRNGQYIIVKTYGPLIGD